MPAPPPPPARPAPAPAGGSPLPPIYPLPAHAAAGHRTPRSMGRDNVVPPHTVTPRTQGASAEPHTRQQAHTPKREHASKQAGQRGGRSHTVPPPHQSANTKARKHPHEHAPRVNTNPSHPPSKHAHNKPQQARPQANTRNVPTQQRVGTPSVSAETRVLAEATGTNEAQTTNAGTQKQAHKERANNLVCAVCRLRPQREDSARESRSQ